MINLKCSGQMPLSAGCTLQRTHQPVPTSRYSSTLANLDAMLHTPATGTERAHKVRKQLAYCYSELLRFNPSESAPFDPNLHPAVPVDVLERLTPVPVRIKRTRKIDAGMKIAAELGFVCP